MNEGAGVKISPARNLASILQLWVHAINPAKYQCNTEQDINQRTYHLLRHWLADRVNSIRFSTSFQGIVDVLDGVPRHTPSMICTRRASSDRSHRPVCASSRTLIPTGKRTYLAVVFFGVPRPSHTWNGTAPQDDLGHWQPRANCLLGQRSWKSFTSQQVSH